MLKDGDEPDTFSVLNATTVEAIAPAQSNASKSGDGINTFTFDRVFDGETSQLSIFESTLQPVIPKMLAGFR